MSASGPKEAIDAINACAELTPAEKATARAVAIRDSNVAQGIVATPAAERADTIRQLIAPPPAAAAPAAAVPMEEVIEAAVNKGVKRALAEQEQKPISMSSAGSSENWSIITKAGFVLAAVSWSDDLTATLRGGMDGAQFHAIQPQAFQWNEDERVPESSQKNEYVEYLAEFIVLPRDQRLAAAPPKLLDLSDKRLGFRLSGTSDCVILDRLIENTIGMQHALRATVELKKKVSERDVKQAAAELISADVHAQTLRPFAVVTDLIDDWRFLWLQGYRIMALRVPMATEADPYVSRRLASLLLRLLLAEGSEVLVDRQHATAVLDALPIDIGKRQKLSPVKERRGSGEEREAFAASAADDDDDDVDGPGWDEEDRVMVLRRQVRQMLRYTPWLQDVCRPPILAPPMSAAARSMFA